ncbi:MAG: hypothetical protein KBC02_02615 [Candidatus Pacebacteria bacterium]|nr:hypothetical protein [Candidatus Paceibacterota bacterium]
MTPELLTYSLKVSLGIVVVGCAMWYGLSNVANISSSMGVIEGSTNYPGEYIPEQIVCAEAIGSNKQTCVTVSAGDAEQLIPQWSLSVPEGEYYVSARVRDPQSLGSDLGDYLAYYSNYVTCGLAAHCTDHSRISVVVSPKSTTTGILPYDWYSR